MTNYELMYMIKTAVDEEGIKSLNERFTQLIAELGGEVVKVDELGKRRLAYEIDDMLEAYYVVIQFKADPQSITELDRQLGLTESIIRHMIVNEDE